MTATPTPAWPPIQFGADRTTDLEALCGLHWLDARGEIIGTKKEWDDDAPRVVVLRLDGILCWFQENPSDGYRSSLSHVRIAEPGDLPSGALAAFPKRLVSCQVRKQPVDPWPDSYPRFDHVLMGTDEATGTLLFEIGTENTDDYYPSFISHWSPPP